MLVPIHIKSSVPDKCGGSPARGKLLWLLFKVECELRLSRRRLRSNFPCRIRGLPKRGTAGTPSSAVSLFRCIIFTSSI